jgi:hypothetical protein
MFRGRFSQQVSYICFGQKESSMLNDPLFILAAIAALAVVVILALGISSFGKGGEFSRKYSNRLMRYRLAAQFVAVVLIVAFAYFRAN